MVLKLPAPPPCLSPKVSDIKPSWRTKKMSCHCEGRNNNIPFQPSPTQHFVSPMPAKTLLAAISEEGDVRIEWLEKWWCRVRERIDGTLFLERDWALSFCRSKYYALSPFASWAGGRKIVIQALVQGKLFAEKWYMFSDYKQAPPSIAKGLRCIASAFFLFNCLVWTCWGPLDSGVLGIQYSSPPRIDGHDSSWPVSCEARKAACFLWNSNGIWVEFFWLWPGQEGLIEGNRVEEEEEVEDAV